MVQQYERKYTNEYMDKEYSDMQYHVGVWLGIVPPGENARALMVTGKRADAIVFTPSEVTIIEFKLEPASKAIGQLQMYEQEFKVSPRFRQYWGASIQKVLVTTRVDDAMKALCENNNIEYRVFRPSWIDYWETIRFRLPGYKKISTNSGSQ